MVTTYILLSVRSMILPNSKKNRGVFIRDEILDEEKRTENERWENRSDTIIADKSEKKKITSIIVELVNQTSPLQHPCEILEFCWTSLSPWKSKSTHFPPDATFIYGASTGPTSLRRMNHSHTRSCPCNIQTGQWKRTALRTAVDCQRHCCKSWNVCKMLWHG